MNYSPYKVLGVGEDATDEQIKAAHEVARRAAMGSGSVAQLGMVDSAFLAIANAHRRARLRVRQQEEAQERAMQIFSRPSGRGRRLWLLGGLGLCGATAAGSLLAPRHLLHHPFGNPSEKAAIAAVDAVLARTEAGIDYSGYSAAVRDAFTVVKPYLADETGNPKRQRALADATGHLVAAKQIWTEKVRNAGVLHAAEPRWLEGMPESGRSRFVGQLDEERAEELLRHQWKRAGDALWLAKK
jgi:hypothetical protein